MKSWITPSVCAAALLLTGTLFTGCTSQQRTSDGDLTESPSWEVDEDRDLQRGDSWPGMSGGGYRWSSLAYPSGNPATSVVGVEKGVPSQVRLNQPFEYKLVVTNLTANTLSDVSVTDDPGENMVYNGADPEGEVLANGNVRWVLGSMAPNETREITVRSTATAEGTVGSCASVTYNSLLCATIPVVQPALSVTKSGPAEVLQCDDIQYRFVVTNTGSATLNDVRVNDPLPQGLTNAQGGRNIQFDVGTLEPGQSRELTATARATRTGSFTNAASASGGGVEANSGEVTTVVRKPVLEITKTGPERQFINRNSTYEITVTNTGDGEARDTVITDAIPAGATFVSASGNGAVSGNTVTWNVGTIEPGDSRNVSVTLTRGEAGTLRNEATARAYCADAVSAVASTEYSGVPAILLEVVDLDDPILVGNRETYVITITNQGTAPDNNIRITVNLEDEQRYVSSEGPTQGTARGQTITFAPIPALAPKQRATYRVVVDCVAPGDIRFGVTMQSDELGRPVNETEATNIYE